MNFNITFELKKLIKSKIIETSNSCMEWQGARSPSGYGEIKIQGKKYNTHRVVYRIVCGVFDYSLWVLHKCDNPPCCNPDHLFLGTRSDNMKDCFKKGRLTHIYNKRPTQTAQKNHMAKLSKSRINFIRKHYKPRDEKFGATALGKRFNVSKGRICDVVHNRTYIITPS